MTLKWHLYILLLASTASANERSVKAEQPNSASAQGIFRSVEKDGTVVYSNVKPATGTAKKMKGEFRAAPLASAPADISVHSSDALAQYDALIEVAATKYRVPKSLVKAVMHAESAFDSNAISPVGASGLMQLMPGTAREMFVKDIFDARDNIEGGVRYLRVLANEFQGDMVKIVAAYNAGPEAVHKYGEGIPPYTETQAYVRKVLNLYFQYAASNTSSKRD
jgi:soluble lytic murein transglycosylase-like protein